MREDDPEGYATSFRKILSLILLIYFEPWTQHIWEESCFHAVQFCWLQHPRNTRFVAAVILFGQARTRIVGWAHEKGWRWRVACPATPRWREELRTSFCCVYVIFLDSSKLIVQQKATEKTKDNTAFEIFEHLIGLPFSPSFLVTFGTFSAADTNKEMSPSSRG